VAAVEASRSDGQGHRFFERWGVCAIVLGRFWRPRASVTIVAGIVEMPWLRFQIANFASAFLWAFLLLSPGTFGLRWWLN
jgi:membrane protein DedA with SNARE-associated domain